MFPVKVNSSVHQRLSASPAAVHYRVRMTRYGAQYGPDVTFLGVDRCDLDNASTYARAEFDEGRWTRWNLVRVVLSVVVFAALLRALVLAGRLG